MGDRANIELVAYDASVFLYTHWNGFEIEKIALEGLAEAVRGGRGTDGQYGSRIVTDVFLRHHAGTPHTGAGISASIGDGGERVVRLNFDAQLVTLPSGEEISFAEAVRRA